MDKWSLNQLIVLRGQAGEELLESERLMRDLTTVSDSIGSEITCLT
jgi:hypothetical protein